MTLIEIMVAMLIGLFLIGGVMNSFVSSKASSAVQEAVVEIDENSRFSMEMLASNIRLAGYKKDPWASTTTVFPATTMFPVAGQFTSGVEGGANQADTINIRYLGSVDSVGVVDGRVTDCEGTPIGNVLVEQSFSIIGSELICTINGATPQQVMLAENVTNMQILYGEDVSGNGSVNKFVQASSVTDWSRIISVKIGLVFNSEDQLAKNNISFPSIADNPKFVMFDQNVDGEPDIFKSTVSSNFDSKTAPDKSIYKVFTTSITFRNLVL